MLAVALDHPAQRRHVPAIAAVASVTCDMSTRTLLVGITHGRINRKQRMPHVPDNRAS
jgi:hypothetical protein